MFVRKYLKPYWKLLALVLILATINQVFSLLDPQVNRWLLDNFILKYKELAQSEFIRGITLGLA